MPELSGFGCSWEGQMGKHKHRAFPCQLQLLLAVTGLLEENMLPAYPSCWDWQEVVAYQRL